MVHAFLTVAMQVLRTPDPSEAIAWGAPAVVGCTVLCFFAAIICAHLLGWPRASLYVRQSLPNGPWIVSLYV